MNRKQAASAARKAFERDEAARPCGQDRMLAFCRAGAAAEAAGLCDIRDTTTWPAFRSAYADAHWDKYHVNKEAV